MSLPEEGKGGIYIPENFSFYKFAPFPHEYGSIKKKAILVYNIVKTDQNPLSFLPKLLMLALSLPPITDYC